ncbi:uncharacterized protein LOC131635532 [Vicia villosa]|uniref:uncharacterized protein LOC131635532 n=1 Tax=Vicia villosa TaxID=3911 RepID=UPI00273CEEDE|nr:uncharacterized protein LOC131635532 [Vicia villosa]
MENRGDISEMKQLLNLLDDNKYVSRTILDKEKEKFVCEWTDNVRHLENTTTNRVKSEHASLKIWLANNKGDWCRDWDSVNLMIKNQHKEIQTTFVRSITVLEHRFKDNILYSQYIGNVSRAGLNYIFYEAKRGEVIGSDNAKCGCTISKMYGLPCACVIDKNIELGEAIRMDEVILHWKRLSFDDDGCIEREKSHICIISELEMIQERFSKADDNMKIYIKELLQKIGYCETTDMKPLSQAVKTKVAPNKLKPTPNDNSTTRAPSYCEHVDKLFSNSLTPKSQKSQTSSNKEARISKPPPTPILSKIPITKETPIPPKILFIEEM